MDNVFDKLKDLRIAVLGDYCLDEYLRIDASLNEPSLETGLVAYQCAKRETFPGAAGTVAKNLAVLGVGQIFAAGYIGDDGRGLEMRRGLQKLGIDTTALIDAPDRATPAYTKPWITENGSVREMSRIDIKNWTPTPPGLERAVMEKIEALAGRVDALMVLDQMTEENCGVITGAVRERLAALAQENPRLIVYADSRSRIGLFRNMLIKGNQYEITCAAFGADADAADENTIRRAAEHLYARGGGPVVVTMGAAGLCVYDGGSDDIKIPGIAVEGQLDVCGAGDAFSAAFVSALAAGAQMRAAAAIGNAAAAVCVTQLGTSGYITAGMIADRMGGQ